MDTLKGHSGKIFHIDFNRQGTHMASCSKDLKIKIWALDKGTCVRTLQDHEHAVSCVKYLPDGDKLLSSSWDKTIKLWDTANGFCLKTFRGHEDWVQSISINEIGENMISSDNNGALILWNIGDVNIKEPIMNMFQEHEKAVDVVIFAPKISIKAIFLSTYNRRKYVAQGEEGDKTGEEQKEAADQSAQDDEQVNGTMTAKERLKMLKAKKAKMKALKEQAGAQEEEVKEGEGKREEEENIDPKAQYFATGSRDKNIKLWDMVTCEAMITLEGHD